MNYIGIDLGTTTSEVAVYRNGKSEIIKNIEEEGEGIIPSIVMIEDGIVYVGQKPKNQMILKSDNVVSEVKRYMGTDKKFIIEGKSYTPVEISSKILLKLKKMAEFYIGEKVENAVITVPANFNNNARVDTRKAALLAGINVDLLINEPTAAAIAYGFYKGEENRRILVYDFGGGTIDVTVLEIFNGVFDVKSSRGKNIGGKDIDDLIIKYMMDKFYEIEGVALDKSNLRVMSMLKNMAEESKKQLSFNKSYNILIPYICTDENGNLKSLDIVITQSKMNELIREIIDMTSELIDDALNGAFMTDKDIDKVLLVGGSSRIQIVKDMIAKRFGLSSIVVGVDPDQSVALGAAIESALKNNDDVSEKSIVIADASSHTLGVEVYGHKFDPIIPRDTKLPTSITKQYKTVEDDQEEAYINIYEGESEDINDNILLDKLVVNNIPKAEKGRQLIDITFMYDLNGILNVDVVVKSTGKIKSKTIICENNILPCESKENIKYENNKSVSEGEDTLVNECEKEEILEENRYSHGEEHCEEVKENVFKENKEINIENQSIQDNEVKEVSEERIDENSSADEDKIDEDISADEDYSTIYTEVAYLSKYVTNNLKNFEQGIQDDVKEDMYNLLQFVKANDYKSCREIEHKVLKRMGIE